MLSVYGALLYEYKFGGLFTTHRDIDVKTA